MKKSNIILIIIIIISILIAGYLLFYNNSPKVDNKPKLSSTLEPINKTETKVENNVQPGISINSS